MPVVYDVMGAVTQNHLHMSSSKICNMLSNATGYPDCSKNLHKVVFQHAESKSDLLPDHSSNTSFKIDHWQSGRAMAPCPPLMNTPLMWSVLPYYVIISKASEWLITAHSSLEFHWPIRVKIPSFFYEKTLKKIFINSSVRINWWDWPKI